MKQDIGGALFFFSNSSIGVILKPQCLLATGENKGYLDLVAFKATDSESRANYSARTHLRDWMLPSERRCIASRMSQAPKTGRKMYVLLS